VQQVTTITLFRFDHWRYAGWAFAQMGLAPRRLAGASPFFKLLGTGGGNGFSAKPNFSVYSMLAVWPREELAWQFFANNPVFNAYADRASTHQTFFLQNTMAHGLWDGQQPFEASTTFDPNAMTAVITRATIRTNQLRRFWNGVPGTSADVHQQEGLLFATGVGELPWIQQATFSVWATGRDMMRYAYKGEEHRKVIEQTRALGWYKEELFARFVPYRIEGSGFY
jgi:hypothetical protein